MRLTQLFRDGIKYIFNKDYRFFRNAKFGFYKDMPDEQYIKRLYKSIFGYEINLENPTLFSEKLQWLKLHNRKEIYSTMVDKYKAKDFVGNLIGYDKIIPLLGVWDKPEDIPYDTLPDKFVLKCNHNSGTGMYICKDKSKIDISRVNKNLKKGLKEDYFSRYREWPYKNVERKIIAEKFMENDSELGLVDYKVMCFNGEVKYIQVHTGRFGQHFETYYDIDWNMTNLSQGDIPIADHPIEKPLPFDEMLKYSEFFAKGQPYMNVDWYVIEDKLYFGELTFFDGAGFEKYGSMEYEKLLGSMVDLNYLSQD
ncbi:MAG: hypothetical protein K6F82_05665 [Sphaerochaetaceae bacterium]|nr:hypothetical protein [Sphaerochaetaceae bacterium]